MVTTPEEPGSTHSGASDGEAPLAATAGQPTVDRASGRVILDRLAVSIDKEGTWFYHGSPIRRKELVCLFASALVRDESGDYWLITPREMGRVQVADVPFIGVELYAAGSGPCQTLSVRTNVDEIVTIDHKHPLRVPAMAETGESIPYLLVRDGIEARIARHVFYEMVSLGAEADVAGERWFGVWSSRQFFPLGKLNESV